MNNLNIAEIRAVAEKATPGPWEHILNDKHGRSIFHRFEICKIIKVSSTFSEDDAEFICRSRQWVPALCDRVEEQDKQLADKGAEIATLRRALEMACERNAEYAFTGATSEMKSKHAKKNVDHFIQQAREEPHAN